MKKFFLRLVIILFILSLIAVGGYFGYNYYLESKNGEVKNKFYSYVVQNNFNNIFDYSVEGKIFNKLKNEKYESKTNIDFSNTFNNNNNFEFDKLTIELNTLSDVINKQNRLKFNYSNNELFTIDILSNEKYIAFKNNDVLNNYIGIKKSNSSEILSRINPNLQILYKNIDEIKNENYLNTNSNTIFSNNVENYLNELKKYVKSNNYTEEGPFIIEQNGEKKEVQSFSMSMSKEEFMNIYSVLTQMLIDDDNIKNSIISKTEEAQDEILDFESILNFKDVVINEEKEEIHALRGEADSNNNQENEDENYSTDLISESTIISKLDNLSTNINNKIEEYESYKLILNSIKYLVSATSDIGLEVDEEDFDNELNDIFESINKILDEKIDEKSNVKITAYVSDGKTVKTILYLGNNLEVNLDYITQSSNKYITNITISEKQGENYNGYTISLIKNKTTAVDNNSIEIGIIKDSEIVSKIEIKLNVEGTISSNSFNNNLSFLYSASDGKFTSNFSNKLTFSNKDIESINSENTLLIDNLKNDEFNYLVNKLNSKIDSVYKENLSKLNLINANSSNTIIQNSDIEENNISNENQEEKEHIIDLLVEKISDEMGSAQNEGKEYTIKNLKDFKLEGYEVKTSVSNDIAIIKINNYTFKIDKDFNLSE